MSLTREELIAGSSPESELEAGVWHLARHHRVTCDAFFVESVIVLAKAYAAGDSEQVTANRRSVLAGHGYSSVTVCDPCRRNHIRSMPIERTKSCLQIPCQCWCTDRDDKPLEVD